MPNLFSYLTGGSNRIKLTKDEYIKVYLVAAAIFGFIVIFGLEVTHIHNTFEVPSLMIRSLILGALLGASISYQLSKKQPDLDIVGRFRLWVGLMVLCMIVLPPMAHFSNRILAFRSVQEVPVQYIKSDAFFASRFGQLQGEQMDISGYYIFIVKDDKLKRIKSKFDLYEKAEENSEVLLPLRKGFWGYEYVSFPQRKKQ